jgi:hypothetical protein
MSTLRARPPSEQVDAALMEAEGDIGPCVRGLKTTACAASKLVLRRELRPEKPQAEPRAGRD